MSSAESTMDVAAQLGAVETADIRPVTTAAVEAELAEVCGQLNVLHGRLVDLVAAALESGCWEGAGILSCAQWVAWQTGLSPGRARDLVAMARRRTDLPETFAALAAGELSVDQATVVARHTPTRFEADVVTLARSATVAQLRRTLSRYRFDDQSDRERSDPCVVSGWYDADGRYRMRVVLDADHGAAVDAALREARDALFHAGDGQVTGVDALVEMAHRSLAAVTSPARREVFSVLFHVTTDHPHGWLHQGPVLPDTLRRQLLCDTSGTIIGLRHGRPVDVGRRQRIVPITLRRLVEDRDRGCRIPGCTNRRVEVHHIHHWEDGGPTAAHNLICLCHRHHRMHHRGLLGITGNPELADGLIITDRHGRTLTGLPPEPAQHVDPIPVTGAWTHPTGERLHTHWIHFNPRTQPAPARPG